MKDHTPHAGLFTARQWKLLLYGGLLAFCAAIAATALLVRGAGECGAGDCVGCGTVNPAPFRVTDAAGKALFFDNCAACHNPLKDATGPALQPALRLRARGFLRRFLNSPRSWPHDSLASAYKKSYVTTCVAFPNLAPEARDHIERYIRQE